MTVQRSTAARNARLNAIPATWGASPKVRIYTGSQPATCATAPSGTLLVEFTLGSTPFASASGGSMGANGLPVSAMASGSGTAGYYRVYDNAGTTCHEQGSVAASGSPDMTIDNASIVTTQMVNIQSWTVNEPGA